MVFGVVGENYPRSVLNRVRGPSALCSLLLAGASLRPILRPGGLEGAPTARSPPMRTFDEPSDSPRDPVLNIDQVCAVLAVSRPTLMAMIEAGEAPRSSA